MPLLALYAWRFGLCLHLGPFGPTVCTPGGRGLVVLGSGPQAVDTLLALVATWRRGGEA